MTAREVHVDPEPAPPYRHATGPWSVPHLALVVVGVLALLAGSSAATWYLAGADDQVPVAQPATAAAPTTTPPTTTAAPSTAAPSTTVGGAGSVTALSAQADLDRGAAQGLVGRWVPQLSSKAVGMTVDGTTYDEASILAHFRSLQDRYPGAVLVRSADYPSFRNPGFWVVLAGVPFDDASAANAWCETAGIGVDDCYAKRLVTDGGPDGNTVRRTP